MCSKKENVAPSFPICTSRNFKVCNMIYTLWCGYMAKFFYTCGLNSILLYAVVKFAQRKVFSTIFFSFMLLCTSMYTLKHTPYSVQFPTMNTISLNKQYGNGDNLRVHHIAEKFFLLLAQRASNPLVYYHECPFSYAKHTIAEH